MSIKKYSLFFFDKLFIYFLLLLFGLSCLPYMALYTDEIAFLSTINEDAFDNIRNVDAILQPHFDLEYFKLFIGDCSGSIWWLILAIVALPFKIIGSEQGMIISIRIFALLLPTLASFYLCYLILKDFAKNRFFLLLLYLIIIFAFFTPANVNEVGLGFPEPLYIFFLSLSFYFLYKASNQFNKYFYYSILAFAISVSIKILGALYGIVYLIYFIYNFRKLNILIIIKSISLGLMILLVLNSILLHPQILKYYLERLKDITYIGNHGFPQFVWFRNNPPQSISFFSSNYIHIYFFVAILLLFVFASLGMFFKKSKGLVVADNKYAYLLMPFAVVAVYFLYGVFYMWMLAHYSLPIICFLPFVIFGTFYLFGIYLCKKFNKLMVFLLIVLIGYLAFFIPPTNRILKVWLLLKANYGKNGYPTIRYNAVKKVGRFLSNYRGPLGCVGAPRTLAIPLINNKKINYYHLDDLSLNRLFKSDLLIFWKKDWVYQQNFLCQNLLEHEGRDHSIYLKIKNGEIIKQGDGQISFERLFEDNEFEIYKIKQRTGKPMPEGASFIHFELPAQLQKYDATSTVHISSKAEAEAVRKRIIDYFWPESGLPTTKLPVVSNVYNGRGFFPVELNGICAALVSRIEKLTLLQDFNYYNFSFLIYPKNLMYSKRMVIIHQGHQGGLTDGIATLANRRLQQGYVVLLMQMPLIGWNANDSFKTPQGPVTSHELMILMLEDKGGSALRFFVEPAIVGINYFIAQNPDYENIIMIGLSGGGWTTHIASAIDARIRLSIPVAGSYPLFVRPYYAPGSIGDAEQLVPAFYKERASYLDLYILGGYGPQRRQIQILNQFDSSCFYGVGYKTYKDIVSSRVKALGGQWDFVLDSSHKRHQISEWAIEQVIEKAIDEKEK